MIAPARTAAYDVLRAVSAGTSDLPHALARERNRLTDERDRALTTEIATGTLRWQGAFDHLIAQFARRPLSKLDPEVVDILRLTIYQLLHLDRVPASAAVNDAVTLTRRAGKQSAAPLVNAVLRRVSRERNRLPLPARPDASRSRDDILDYLSTTLAHPRWLAARWLDRYGFAAAEAWEQFDNVPALLTLRVNRLRTTPEQVAAALAVHGVRTSAGRFAADALIVNDGNPLLTPLAETGLFFVQDEASQLVALMADVKPGDRILDACAAPGGKTTALAAGIDDRGLIVATDLRGKRVDLLARTITISGAQSVRVVRADASGALPFGAQFDWILLDAPCSGLGTIRRDPEVRWRRAESDLAVFAEAQLRMLSACARVLRPNGRLVYATCSSEPEENEQVVTRFLERGTFEPVRPSHLAPAVQGLVNESGYLRTYPFRDRLEAFFAAILLKLR